MRKIALLAALLAVSACQRGGEPEPAAEAAGRPADRPLMDRGAVQVREIFRLGAAGWSASQLAQPRDLEIDAEGNLYVLDIGGAEPRLLKFAPDGRYLLRLGEEGGEETRLISALEFDVAPWNTVFIVDRGRNVLTSYLTLGFHTTTVQIQGQGLDVLALSRVQEFYLHKWVPEAQRVQVLHMRAPLDSLGTTYTVFIPPGRTVREEARDVFFRTAVDRSDRLYVAFHDGYPVRVLTPSGETVRLIDLDRAPARKSAEAIEAERAVNLQRLRQNAPDVADSLLMEAAEPDSVAAMIAEMEVDPFDRLWVRTSRADAVGVTPYDVFNERGEYLARIDVPGEVRRTAFDADGRLYVIDASDEARPAIIGYEVRLGP